MTDRKTALIAGASRGLGLAIVEELLERGWDVIGTAREGSGTRLHALADASQGRLRTACLDITVPAQVEQLRSALAGQVLDLLFVNAGVANRNGREETIGQVSTEEFVRVMVTNALSPMRVLEQLTANVRPGGVIGVMSSGQGSITNNISGENDTYRASKAALNMIMRSFAVRHGQDHALLLLAPGWIRTDMGGEGAPISIEEAIGAIVDTLVAQHGHPGLRYLDRFGQPVNW